jgi:hypothetical protein
VSQIIQLLDIRDFARCEQSYIDTQIETTVSKTSVPILRLDLEAVNDDLNVIKDLAAKDAGVRIRAAIRHAIQILETR